MMRSIIHRYIFRDLCKTFFLTTMVLSLVMGLGFMLRPLRQLSVEPARVPELFLYSLPITLTMVLPIAALLAATLNYSRLALDNEINACRSSGISLLNLVYPALILALMVGLFTMLLGFLVIPSFIRKTDAILKADAEAIIFRNIQKTGNLGRLGRKFSDYRIHADQVDPDQHRLTGVVVEDKKSHLTITAKEVDFNFVTRNERSFIRLRLRDAISIRHNQTESENPEVGAMTCFIPLPSFWKDDVKFKRFGDMQAIQRDMTLFEPVRTQLNAYRREMLAEASYQWINLQLSQPPHYVDLWQGDDRLRLWADSCSVPALKTDAPATRKINDDFVSAQIQTVDGVAIRIEVFAGNVAEEPERIYDASEGEITLDPLANTDELALVLREVQWSYAGGEQRFSELGNHQFLQVAIPSEIAGQVRAYSLDDLLQASAPPISQPTPYLQKLHRSLNKLCRRLQAEIVLELHARLAVGVSCVVLVMLGAALGIILRSGPLLSAFGVSAIPAVLCLMTIFAGKHIGEQGGTDMSAGIAFLWSGIAVLVLADLLIYRNLLKR